MPKLTEAEMLARDAERDLDAELSEAARQLRDGEVGRVSLVLDDGRHRLAGDQRPVGWTSESDVHRTPRRRWWTALRLSLRRNVSDVAGVMGTALRVRLAEAKILEV